MIPLITLRDPVVTRLSEPEDRDPEDAFAGARFAGYDLETAGAIAAYAAHLPMAHGEDERPLGWSIREVRHLRFMRWLVDHAGLLDDLEAAD